MTLIGKKARNHPQQIAARNARAAQGSLLPEPHRFDVDDRSTPQDLWDRLHEKHQFTVDAAASPANTKLPRFWTVNDSALDHSWKAEIVWCNPPYSEIRPWIEKALTECVAGCRLVVMLLPANRTEQGWWQELIEPVRDTGKQHDVAVATEFLRGRLRFDGVEHPVDGKGNRPPFGCVLVTFRGNPS